MSEIALPPSQAATAAAAAAAAALRFRVFRVFFVRLFHKRRQNVIWEGENSKKATQHSSSTTPCWLHALCLYRRAEFMYAGYLCMKTSVPALYLDFNIIRLRERGTFRPLMIFLSDLRDKNRSRFKTKTSSSGSLP